MGILIIVVSVSPGAVDTSNVDSEFLSEVAVDSFVDSHLTESQQEQVRSLLTSCRLDHTY